jgi:DnaJ-domain-containing protein 1
MNLTNKINELDIIISKYGKNLINIKKSYEKSVYDHQVENLAKNNDLRQMQEKYEKKIREVFIDYIFL